MWAVMSRQAWLTPDLAPETRQCWRVFVPDSEEMRAAFRGALHLLSLAYNWELFGAASPDDCAQVWKDANYETFSMAQCVSGGSAMHIGEVFWFASETPPSGCLVCDGSLYDTGDYPLLFSILGYGWGGTGSNFAVPDLRGRFIRGLNTGDSIADIGGEETHSLTVAEMPNHTHEYDRGASAGGVPTVSVATVARKTGVLQTDSSGSGLAHNNMPPYHTLVAMIQAET